MPSLLDAVVRRCSGHETERGWQNPADAALGPRRYQPVANPCRAGTGKGRRGLALGGLSAPSRRNTHKGRLQRPSLHVSTTSLASAASSQEMSDAGHSLQLVAAQALMFTTMYSTLCVTMGYLQSVPH